MTTTELLAFLRAAQATLHVRPNGDVLLMSEGHREDKNGNIPVTTNTRGDLDRAINDHARKVFQ